MYYFGQLRRLLVLDEHMGASFHIPSYLLKAGVGANVAQVDADAVAKGGRDKMKENKKATKKALKDAKDDNLNMLTNELQSLLKSSGSDEKNLLQISKQKVHIQTSQVMLHSVQVHSAVIQLQASQNKQTYDAEVAAQERKTRMLTDKLDRLQKLLDKVSSYPISDEKRAELVLQYLSDIDAVESQLEELRKEASPTLAVTNFPNISDVLSVSTSMKQILAEGKLQLIFTLIHAQLVLTNDISVVLVCVCV